jgi:SAM-dependent methyltransferase
MRGSRGGVIGEVDLRAFDASLDGLRSSGRATAGVGIGGSPSNGRAAARRARWKHGLIEDVLAKWILDGGVVLEIGPGAGRWSKVLASRASRLVLADVSERPLELCRERFNGDTRIEYVLSSGSDLPGVEDGSIEAVWSFDVFVHVAPGDQAACLGEIARVLAPGGTAVVHHSDGRNRGQLPSRSGWRSPMSRRLFAALAAERGLKIECQFDSWGPDGRYDLSAYGDAITVCKR